MSARPSFSLPWLAFLLVATASAVPNEEVSGPFTAAAATNALACDLHGELRAGEGNLCFSPLSIATALAMAHAGARGETARQMERALHLPAEAAATHAAFGAVVQRLARAPKTESGGFSLRLASSLWVQKGQELLPAFNATLRDAYAAEAQLVDFRTRSDTARLKINAWVEKATNFKIREILAPGSVSADTPAILVNALYLRAAWDVEIEKTATHDSPFHLADGRELPVPTMMHTAELS
jgi:serpin B